MPTELASEMATYKADEQKRRENQAKLLAEFVASQPGPRNVLSGSKKGSGNWQGEDTAAGADDDSSQERSEFAKQWKSVRFSCDKVEELLKEEPTCDQCLKSQKSCTIVPAKLTCRECQRAKVVCPRNFNNKLRALGQKLKESEDVVCSKHTRFMTKGKQRGDEVSKAKAKGKGREKEQLPKIVIPGGRGSKSNETRSERSNSRAPCEDNEVADDEDELNESEMDVDVPGKSKPQSRRSHSSVPQVPVDAPGGSLPQSRCSDSQVPNANNNQKANEAVLASKIAVDVPETSEPQPRHSHSQVPQVPHLEETQLANEADNSLELHVDTPASLMPKSSHFPSPMPDISFELKHKIWDELSRAGLYTHLEASDTRQVIMRQLLDDVTSAKDDLANHVDTFSDALKECQMRVKVLEDGDLLATLKREWTDAGNLLKEARSEVQQAVNQRLETESDLSELRRKMKELEEERDEALREAQGVSRILQELRDAQSEAPQTLEAESELSELRRKVKVLAEERDDALKEAQGLKNLLDEAQGLKQFGLGAPSDPSPAQHQWLPPYIIY